MLRKQCYGEHELSARAQKHCACQKAHPHMWLAEVIDTPPTHRQYALKRGEIINSRT